MTNRVPAQRAISSPSRSQRLRGGHTQVMKAPRAGSSPDQRLSANRPSASTSDPHTEECPAHWASRIRCGRVPGPLAPAGRMNGPSGRKPVANTRRGFTLIELIATCILLGVVFSVSIPLLTVVAHERRSAEQRQFALQHATNLLERATTKSWSELKVGNQELTAAPTDVQTLLPGLERRVEVKELSETPRSKQVEVSVRWKSRSGELVAPLRLSAWVYPNGEGQP